MALTFPTKVRAPQVAFTAAQMEEIIIDLVSNRVIARLVFGNVISGNFVRDKEIPPLMRVVETPNLSNAAQIKTLQSLVWQRLAAAGYESGTEV